MNTPSKSLSAFRSLIWAVGLIAVVPGCFWQRDSYTTRMIATFDNWEKLAELDRLLGEPFHPAEFAMWIRPPKPTQMVQTPEQFVVWFQGNDAGGALIEVLVIGSSGQETMDDFRQNAFSALKAAQKWPAQDPSKEVEPQKFQCLHGGETSFDLYHGSGQRQTQTGGAPATPVPYQWLIYFGEEAQQKVMICFIVPDAAYSNFGPALMKCMESLALSSKVGVAEASGGAPAPRSGGPGF